MRTISAKERMLSYAVSIAISLLLGSLGLISYGCKSTSPDVVYVIENKNVVTNVAPTKAFNDERYVWEKFIFSTNRVDEAKK